MEGGIELQLYVATPSFADTQQYLDSELLLATINAHELKKRVKVDRLDNLWEHEDFFDCINDPGQETKLP
ncbi:MAG: hypothetical protein QF584_00715, partial [Candidatus Woesearchaeota archaeon]|nr:hypothetical protein [Candidatus Woesearchaeota archaeon]